MKILFTNFHGFNGGGHVTYILALARELSRTHDVSIATPGTSRLYRYAQDIPALRVIDQRYSSRIFRMFPEVRQLRRLLAKEHYDIVHVNGSADHRHVMLACRGLAKRPRIVWTKHNDHQVTSLGNSLRARWATDHVIAVSSFIHGMLDGSPYESIPQTVIRHGIDTDYFSPPDDAQKHQLRTALFGPDHEQLIVFGSTGGTDYDKGWLDLLAAIAKLPPEQRQRCRVVVAGAPLKQDKADLVSKLGMTGLTVFPGLVDEVLPLLRACDIGFVLSYREALSYACREAMATGLPALVSNVGGLPENVENGVDGWIVPPKAPDAIRDVLMSVLSEPGRIPQMGAAARQKSESEFALSLFVDRTFSVYEETLAGLSV